MSRLHPTGVPLPDGIASTVVASRAGAPSALVRDGAVHLAYRDHRAAATVVARSEDGVRVEVVAEIRAPATAGRAALVVTPPGRWRLYLDAGARVELLEADSPEGIGTASPATVLEGAGSPVVQSHGGVWHLWAAVGGDTVRYASPDGLVWAGQEVALAAGRISSVVDLGDRLVATYDDGEHTAVAVPGDGFGRFRPVDEVPAAPGLRHLAVLALPGGSYQLYYEATGPDGVPEIRTEVAPAS
ncbi:hypothetical protein [Actinomycetospora sp.]|jgi:hypothetical protein|uniref:hypothetical protein n=1 Tax=Actinomycetospora sp. TaxID=1872135 RepID=UPI002F40BFB5